MWAIDDSLYEDLDRKCFSWSAWLEKPFENAYSMVRHRSISPLGAKFDNAESQIQEIATRALIFATAAVCFYNFTAHLLFASVVIGGASRVLRAVGVALQKDLFTHVRGKAPEQALQNNEVSVLLWPIRGERWGNHYKKGVVHWSSRIDGIVEKIKTADPDILVLSKVYDTAFVEALISRLEEKYAHFYTHLGARTWGNANGCMVITKHPIDHFSHTPFLSTDGDGSRGVEILEIKASTEDTQPCIRIISTEMSPGADAQKLRMDQIAQTIDALKARSAVLPTLFIGATNANSEDSDGIYLSKILSNSLKGADPIHTDKLANQWGSKSVEKEQCGCISLIKRNLPDGTTAPVVERKVSLIESGLVEAFDDEYNTQKALSSDQGQYVKLQLS